MSSKRNGTPDWLSTDLVSELDGCLWHATTSEAFEKIVSEGFIKIPDQSKYSNGFCRGIGAISLFDLRYPDPPPYISHWSEWISRNPLKPSYWFEVDRELTKSSVLSPTELLKRWRIEQNSERVRIIAGIESAHIGPLPLSHTRRTLKISYPHFEVIQRLVR